MASPAIGLKPLDERYGEQKKICAEDGAASKVQGISSTAREDNGITCVTTLAVP